MRLGQEQSGGRLNAVNGKDDNPPAALNPTEASSSAVGGAADENAGKR